MILIVSINQHIVTYQNIEYVTIHTLCLIILIYVNVSHIYEIMTKSNAEHVKSI